MFIFYIISSSILIINDIFVCMPDNDMLSRHMYIFCIVKVLQSTLKIPKVPLLCLAAFFITKSWVKLKNIFIIFGKLFLEDMRHGFFIAVDCFNGVR